jgi:ribonuclease-3
VEESGPDHQKSFRASVRIGLRTYGQGEGRSKKEAEQQAAEAAWTAISAGLSQADDDPGSLAGEPANGTGVPAGEPTNGTGVPAGEPANGTGVPAAANGHGDAPATSASSGESGGASGEQPAKDG